MLTLPENNRHFFKEPFGILFPDIADALPHITGKTLYAVGDIVTHNLKKNGLSPAVAIIDGHTMRSPCTKSIPVTGRHIRVTNPAGTLTDDLIAAIRNAVHDPPATIDVKGEEDLAVIPLVIAAPEGGVVLYGQPQKGIVVRTIDKEAKARAEELFARFVCV